jgi:hypothetical protein
MIHYVYQKIKILQARRATYKQRIEARSGNHRCKSNITHSECLFAAIVKPSVACLDVPYFYTLYHKRHEFRGKKLKVK